MGCKNCGPTGNFEATPSGSEECSDDCTACSTCGSTTSCGCGCSSCGSTTGCGCSTSSCQEDHTTTIVSKRYAYALRSISNLTWPAEGESVTFKVDSVERLAIGTLLYYEGAGYLHVTSFDCVTQEVTAINQGEICNTYTGGELIPACADFVVGPPPCSPNISPIPNIPYLAADFISPAEGECALASVTNITGLTLGDIISINGYQYRISEILTSESIRICNDGDGAPEGTVIFWDSDGDGIPNIPVIVVASENPCTRTAVSAGVLLVCDSLTAKPLVGAVGGQIPVWNDVTERFELKNISAPYTSCTSLTADLIVDPLHVGSYLVLVADTSAFLAGNTVIIDGVFYVVNIVDNSTTMHITPSITPPAIHTYGAGTPVCLYISNAVSFTDSQDSTILTGNVVSGATVDTAVATTTILNSSASALMKVIVHSYFEFDIQTGGLTTAQFQLLQSVNGGAYAALGLGANFRTLGYAGPDITVVSDISVFSTVFSIAPGATLIVANKGRIINGINPTIVVGGAQARIRVLGVAV